MPKIQLKKEDNSDIKEHWNNIGTLSKQINNLIGQRLREIKAAERVWESATLRAKIDKKLPMNSNVPVFLDKNTLTSNIALSPEGVASWEGKSLEVKPKSKPKGDNQKKQAAKPEKELPAKEQKEVTDGIGK